MDWTTLQTTTNVEAVIGNDSEVVEDDFEDPAYYSTRYRIIGTFFQGIIFVFGIVGNLMVVIVVKRTKSMHSPTNCYLVSLAIADALVLVVAVPNEIVSYYLVRNMWLWGRGGCAVFIFAQNLGINASSLSLVALTVERYVAICHPLRAHHLCTVPWARRIVAALWLFATIYCLPWLALTNVKPLRYRGFPEATRCPPRDHYLAYFFTDFLVFYVATLVLSCILYSLIARALLSRSTSTAIPNGTATTTTTTTTSGTSVETPAAMKTRTQTVKMLVVVMIVFAVLWLPLIFNSFTNHFSHHRYMDLWFLMFAKTCIFINCAINPILYNAMSGQFRQTFGKVLGCPERLRINGSSGAVEPGTIIIYHQQTSLPHSPTTTIPLSTSITIGKQSHLMNDGVNNHINKTPV